MGITYRAGHEGRLTVAEMDNNFHYLEDQLVGLTQSNSDRLINNNLEVVLDSKGTLNTPLLIPTSFTASCDTDHMIDTYEFTDNNWWQFEVSFQVNPDGTVESMVNNIFPILTNPGYVSGNSFRFTEQDHGIPDFIFDIQLNSVVLPGGAGWTANLAVTQPPTYPSTIKSLGAIKLTSDTNSITLGTDGVLSIPNNIQFPDDTVQNTAYIPQGLQEVLDTDNIVTNGAIMQFKSPVITENQSFITDGGMGSFGRTEPGEIYFGTELRPSYIGFAFGGTSGNSSFVSTILKTSNYTNVQNIYELPTKPEGTYSLATTDDLPKFFKGIFNQTGTASPVVQEYYNNTGYNFTNWSRTTDGAYFLSVVRNGASFSYINVGQNYVDGELSKTTAYTFLNPKTDRQDYYVYTYDNGTLSDNIAFNMFIEIGLK